MWRYIGWGDITGNGSAFYVKPYAGVYSECIRIVSEDCPQSLRTLGGRGLAGGVVGHAV